MSTLSPCRWRLLAPLLACAVLIASGCGGGEKLYPVQGKVTLDGTNLKAGAVTFVPDAEKGNKTKSSPTGQIGPDGTYTVSTAGRSGAPAGWYKVTVQTKTAGMGGTTPVTGATEAPALVAPTAEIDAKYSDPSKTDLRVEVVASPQANAYDLKVSPVANAP